MRGAGSPRFWWPVVVCAAVCGVAHPASANGAFPQVSQLVADPSDPNHLVLRSNFGLLTTRDAGANWDLVCEGGIGYANIEPPIAVLSDGTTIVALPSGIAHGSPSECAFDLGRGVSAYIADVSRVAGTAAQAVAVSVDIDASVSQVWHSLDDGASWKAFGSSLPALNAATLDVAGSGTSTLYVSGVTQDAAVTGILARSEDGGQSWARNAVPGVSKVSAPYIAAIAPDDANTVFVRLSGTPGHLLVTHDGGQHFETVLDFSGPFDGFALSPDGKLALAAGRVDGVFRARTSDLAFEQISCARLRCLSWTSSGLFACADEFQAGFLVGESTDSGLSFEPRLHLSCVRGPLSCDSASSVGSACTAAWPAISEQLGTDCASAGGFVPNTECSSAGAPSESAGAPNADAGAPKAGASNANGHEASSGCTLGLLGPSSGTGLSAFALLGLCAAAAARRRR